MLSTKIGLVLTVLAILILIAVQSSILPLLLRKIDDASVDEYITQIKYLYKQEYFLHTKVANLYMLLLGSGIFMHIYEYVGKTFWSILITYGCTSAWFLFNYFYLRKNSLLKKQAKYYKLITKMESIKKQIEE